jgi:hypothetical protein
MVPGIKQTAYKVSQNLHTLYNALSAATLTLISTAPTVPFRCAVTISSVTGHSDCIGHVYVGSEDLDFSAAGKKLTKTNLTSIPVITTSSLDCSILITCITAMGADIIKETQAAILCLWVPSQKNFKDSLGDWALSDAIALTKTAFNANDIISFNNYDFKVRQVSGGNRIMGVTAPYKLFLTNLSSSPAGRT